MTLSSSVGVLVFQDKMPRRLAEISARSEPSALFAPSYTHVLDHAALTMTNQRRNRINDGRTIEQLQNHACSHYPTGPVIVIGLQRFYSSDCLMMPTHPG